METLKHHITENVDEAMSGNTGTEKTECDEECQVNTDSPNDNNPLRNGCTVSTNQNDNNVEYENNSVNTDTAADVVTPPCTSTPCTSTPTKVGKATPNRSVQNLLVCCMSPYSNIRSVS